jgi:Cation/multidrug efflux pump
MNIHLKAIDIVVIGISAALYAVFGILTAGFSFLGVGFLPAVVIPAVFAALYGPWVGGLGAAIGIFIRDMFVHGNAALSLVAGVPPNFIVFFLIGYIAMRDISLRKALAGLAIAAVGLLVPTLVFLPDLVAFTGLTTETFLLTFVLTVILSLAVIGVVSIRYKEWRSYAIGAVVGQLLGAALLSVTVVAVSPLFLSYFTSGPLPAAVILPLWIWTFATEVPFVLLLGPPIIKVCYSAFPSLRQRKEHREPQ